MDKNISGRKIIQNYITFFQQLFSQVQNQPAINKSTIKLLSFSVFLSVIFTVFLPLLVSADRLLIDLSNHEWGIFRDFNAEWINDDIYAPPVDTAILPVNLPSCGWDKLTEHFEKTVNLPATVEEYFWGNNGNNEGIAGDWRGVSWWVTTVNATNELRGKRIFLDFESVHLRAEVFVNRNLVGYDVIGHTPFEVDVTKAIQADKENEIAVRITDPNGNFSYNDLNGLRWGKNIIPSNRGFGGITGKVFLKAVDPVYIDDIYVKNKPSIKEVDIIVQAKNLTGASIAGTFIVKVYPWKNPKEVLWNKSFKREIDSLDNKFEFTANVPRAKIWDINHPNLYIAEVVFVSSNNNMKDTMTQRFGFRWFDIGENNGDQRFYLNGKRIVQINAYSWSFWPVNGAYPTREMAERDAVLAKKLGFNMMSVHTAIPYPLAIDAADEKGLLFYEEPGGYYRREHEEKTDLRSKLSQEKLFRMVKRDRSHPSLIIYNMGWNYYEKPDEDNINDMITAHEMDPTRIITFRQGIPRNIPKVDPRKLFMKPNDFTEYHTGFFEECRSSHSQGYADVYYNNPRDYYLYTDITDEIVYWGEDGNIGVPPRLQLIKEFYDKRGNSYGWQGINNIEWYNAYDDFLDRSGFREFFPDVDALTLSLGNVKYYHHGRILENIRVGNVADNYTIIGWASSQRFNHNGMADLYRNPIGNTEIFARYCRPLYVAVKLRDKVVPTGSTVIADFFIVNEVNLKGNHNLTVRFESESGKSAFEKTFKVKIKGGEEYGQLLVENVEIHLDKSPGYFTVHAELSDREGNLKAEGKDKVFAVNILDTEFLTKGAVVDTTGIINRMLGKTWGFTLPEFTSDTLDIDYIIIGTSTYNISDIMEHVATGATAVVIDQADRFAELINEGFSEALDYRGKYPMKKGAFGGNFIAGKHELLSGLPQTQAFNWEYQIFYNYTGQDLFALRLFGGKTIVAAVSDHKKEVGTALCIIPYGRGRLILSTLCILPYLDKDTPQSVVAKRLFRNFLNYSEKN